MSIQNPDVIEIVNGAGAPISQAIPGRFYDDNQVRVWKISQSAGVTDETALVSGGDFTLKKSRITDRPEYFTGTITTTTSVAIGTSLVIMVWPDNDQITDFSAIPHNPADFERQHDLAALRDQSLLEIMKRSPRLPLDFQGDQPLMELPVPGRLVRGRADGKGWEAGPNAAEIESAQEFAERAEAAEVSLQQLIGGFTFNEIGPIVDRDDTALHSIIALEKGFIAKYKSGAITPAYPGVYTRPEIDRPVETELFLANRQVAINRIDRFYALRWTPKATLPGMNGPTFFTQDVEQEGTPYGSVDFVGVGYIGLTWSYEGWATAASNLESILYEDYTLADGYDNLRSSGPLYGGTVCSSIFAGAVDLPIAPTTKRIDRDWRKWGVFSDRLGANRFNISDIQAGDVLNEDGAGHTEYVRAITETTLTLMDMSFSGMMFEEYDIASGEAINHIRTNNYALMVVDYNLDGRVLVDDPTPFAPLPGETHGAPPINAILQLYKGNKSSYLTGELVRFSNVSGAVDELVIEKDGVEHERIASPTWPVDRTFADPGLYTAYCEMADTSISATETFTVCQLAVTASASFVSQGGDVVVSWTHSDNCFPSAIALCDADTNSTTPFMQFLSDDEITSRKFTLPAQANKGEYYIVVQARTAFHQSAISNKPLGNVPLTIGD